MLRDMLRLSLREGNRPSSKPERIFQGEGEVLPVAARKSIPFERSCHRCEMDAYSVVSTISLHPELRVRAQRHDGRCDRKVLINNESRTVQHHMLPKVEIFRRRGIGKSRVH